METFIPLSEDQKINSLHGVSHTKMALKLAVTHGWERQASSLRTLNQSSQKSHENHRNNHLRQSRWRAHPSNTRHQPSNPWRRSLHPHTRLDVWLSSSVCATAAVVFASYGAFGRKLRQADEAGEGDDMTSCNTCPNFAQCQQLGYCVEQVAKQNEAHEN